jgi:hypothetical protein
LSFLFLLVLEMFRSLYRMVIAKLDPFGKPFRGALSAMNSVCAPFF